jgi:hypothetical protein
MGPAWMQFTPPRRRGKGEHAPEHARVVMRCVGLGWQGAYSVRVAAGRGLPALPFPPPSPTQYRAGVV